MQSWRELFIKWYGQPFPVDYVSFDIETTGFMKDLDVPVDFGWTIVRDCKIAHRGNFLLNWTGYPGMERAFIIDRLASVDEGMRKSGGACQYTIDMLEKQGKRPDYVLKFILDLFRKNRQAGGSFIGHNAWSYDSQLLGNIFQESLDVKWEFGENELWDTGCMVKAAVAHLIPYPDEKTLKEYFKRVQYNRQPGLKWNMASCIERYDLVERFGLDVREQHGASFDCYVAHLLFEELRNGKS